MDSSSESRLARSCAELSLCDSNRADASAMKKCLAARSVELPTAIGSRKFLTNLSATFFWFIIINFATSAVHCVHSLKNKYGATITVISAKPCQNALGQFGTCMFMWDCIKSEGIHLGTCSDRFLFGSCCNHNSSLSTESGASNASGSTNQSLGSMAANQSTSVFDSNEESHSRPILSSTTTTVSAPAQQAATEINLVASFTKPDRLFLSSHSSSGQPDYVTTSTAPTSNFSLPHRDHIVSLSYDDLRPSQQKQQAINQVHVPATNSELNSSDYGELPILTTPTTTTTTTTTATILTKVQTPDITPPTILDAHHLTEQSTPLSVNIGSPTHVRPSQQSPSLSQSQQLNAAEVSPVMAYQLVQRPPTTLTSALSSSSVLPPTPPTMSDITQTQRPQQTSSWLSRPSLLANAIFHSFKPYLNPNRQRPTYRPYIGGGFRPQRPSVLNLHQQQRPTMLLQPSTTHNSISTNQQAPSSNQEISMATETSANLTAPSSLSVNQDNNDHHIVNPSTMTDRRRPVDKNSQQQSTAHYEMLAGHATSLASANFNSLLNSSASSSADVTQVGSDYLAFSNSNKTSAQTSLAGTGQPHNSFTSQASLIYENNSNGNQQFSITNTSFSHYQKPLQDNNHEHHHHTITVTNNESVPNPSYPLISSGLLQLATPPMSDRPIEEIQNTINGGSSGHHEQPNKQQESQSTTVGDNNLSVNQTSYIFAPSTASDHNTATMSHTTLQTNISTSGNGNLNSDQSRPSPSMVIGSMPDAAVSLPPTVETTLVQEAHTNFSSAVSTSTSLLSPPPLQPPPQPMPTVTFATSLLKPPHHNHHQIPSSSLPGLSGHQREATCGVTGLYPQSKVVGGKNAAFGAWPWQVSVRKVSFFGFVSTHRCGGAVISNEWIATAGHCVEDLALQSIRIRVGEYEFDSTNEPYPHIERNARKKIVHPQYNFYTYENDLALVQLDQPLQFSPHVAPICLPPDNIDLVGRNATVTGWGRLNEGGILPKILQEVIVPIVSNDKCRDMFLRAGRPEYIPDIFLCAGYEEGGRDSCQGDSGGPLQVKGDDGRWVLAGIISWGIGCAEPLLVGVCSAIQRFKPWIQSTISETTI